MRLASLSIDLDDLACYHAIHALPPPPPGNPAFQLGLQRFLELFDECQVPSTLFVITQHLDDPQVVTQLGQAMAVGHEIASHSHTHPYDFGQLDAAAIRREISHSKKRIATALGHPPCGFRSPGYNLGQQTLEILAELGFTYDSSAFPCPPYYLAKATIMAIMRLLGRPSGSSLTDPRTLLAPIEPYRPHKNHFFRSAELDQSLGLWELPVCVVPSLRIPIIGTSLTLLGTSGFSALYPLLRTKLSFLNIEFHAIDLLDRSDPGVHPELVARQPDLRTPVSSKRAIFKAVISRLRASYLFVTLAQMASRLSEIDHSA